MTADQMTSMIMHMMTTENMTAKDGKIFVSKDLQASRSFHGVGAYQQKPEQLLPVSSSRQIKIKSSTPKLNSRLAAL